MTSEPPDSDRPTSQSRDEIGSLRQRIAVVTRLVAHVRLHLTLLSLGAFVVGLLEAGFLVLIARVGLSVVEDADSVNLVFGVEMTRTEGLGVAAVLIAVRLLVEIASVRVRMGLIYRVTTRLRRDLASAFLRTSWATQQSQPSGTLQQLVVTFPNHGANLLQILSNAGGAALTLVAMLLIAVVVSPQATVVVVTALLVLGVVLRPLRNMVRSRSEASIPHQLAFSNGVAQVAELGLEIQAFGVRPAAEERLNELIANEAAAARRVGLMSQIVSPVYVSLGYAAVLLAVVVVAGVGTSQLATTGAVMLVMLRALGYGQILQNGSVALAQLVPFLNALDESVREYHQQAATSGSERLEAVGSIRFADVHFAYETGRPVLSDISFEVEPGEVIGIIGPSGGGKSTLVQLLLGIREPSTGCIEIGGVDLRTIDRSWWSSKTAFVPQDAHLIAGTIADNIRFWREDLTDEAIHAAARRAYFESEITAFPDGFDTFLGERGHQLSGGQRQRLAIARALAGDPQLLILDEPTSALDERAELAIRDTILSLRGQATVVVIAHRMSTLDACDRLMIIEAGRITAYDSAERLRSNSALFAQAVEAADVS